MPTAWLVFAVYGLCVYRVTRLVTTDTISLPARERLHRAAYAEGVHRGLAWLYELASCDWCVSVWIAAGCVLGWHLGRDVMNVVAAIMALSAIAGMLRERIA